MIGDCGGFLPQYRNYKFPQMRELGEKEYNAWRVDEKTPLEFWEERKNQIVSGEAEDVLTFVPLRPDTENILRHPKAVLSAIGEVKRVKEIYGDDFRFVITTDGKKVVRKVFPFSMRRNSYLKR